MLEKLQKLLGEAKVLVEEPMSSHTTFRIGGPADYFVMPETTEELAAVLKLCKEEQMPYFILGNGSNLLVGDKGFRGVVIQLYKNFDGLQIEGTKVTAKAGAMLIRVAKESGKAGLTGLEFASGIPGTIGGAMVMNAGAYGGEMKDVVTAVTVLTKDGDIKTLTGEEMNFRYRGSVVEDEGYIVLEAVMELNKAIWKKSRHVLTNCPYREGQNSQSNIQVPEVHSNVRKDILPENSFRMQNFAVIVWAVHRFLKSIAAL